MIPSSIEIPLDKQAIKEYLHQKLDEEIRETLWMIDIKKMSTLTSMSERFLEEEILRDPRMRLIERRKSRKRWWLAKQALEVIEEITSEW